jgi:hypothetical protein
MKLADVIRQGLEKKGLQNLREAAKALGISPELLRITMMKGHIPKDKTLSVLAKKLGLDEWSLILTAHQEKVPGDLKDFFLAPSQPKFKQQQKRVTPFSQEQCTYLEKIMTPEEIQMFRKFRQITPEAKLQVVGNIEYIFATQRKRQ